MCASRATDALFRSSFLSCRFFHSATRLATQPPTSRLPDVFLSLYAKFRSRNFVRTRGGKCYLRAKTLASFSSKSSFQLVFDLDPILHFLVGSIRVAAAAVGRAVASGSLIEIPSAPIKLLFSGVPLSHDDYGNPRTRRTKRREGNKRARKVSVLREKYTHYQPDSSISDELKDTDIPGVTLNRAPQSRMVRLFTARIESSRRFAVVRFARITFVRVNHRPRPSTCWNQNDASPEQIPLAINMKVETLPTFLRVDGFQVFFSSGAGKRFRSSDVRRVNGSKTVVANEQWSVGFTARARWRACRLEENNRRLLNQ